MSIGGKPIQHSIPYFINTFFAEARLHFAQVWTQQTRVLYLVLILLPVVTYLNNIFNPRQFYQEAAQQEGGNYHNGRCHQELNGGVFNPAFK